MRSAVSLSFLFIPFGAKADSIDDYVKGAMEKSHIPGISIAIVKDGKVIRAQGYGIGTLELNTPVTPESVFRVASMSKQFCSAAAIMLRDEGKLDFEAPIKTYIPESPSSWDGVKVRHLLSHQSGIPNVTELSSFKFNQEYNEAQFLKFLKPLPLDSEPGAKYHYSNSGFTIMGFIVGRVAKVPLSQFVEENIFRPVGMTASSYAKVDTVVPNRVTGYRWIKDHYENAWTSRPSAMDGSGGILSTVLDFAKWDAALFTEMPLTNAQKLQLWTPNKLNDGKQTVYGFGWTVRSGPDGKTVSHSGNTSGFTSNILRILDQKLTVIVFRNAEVEGAAEMASDIADLYRGRVLKPKKVKE